MAIKVMQTSHDSPPELRERFLRESRACGSLALCRASDEAVLVGAGFHRLQSIHELDGTHSFSVLQK